MNRYTYLTALHYEYDDGSSTQRTIKYTYKKLVYRDASGAEICLDPNFILTISNIVANTEASAFISASRIAEKVCKVLTLVLQFSNYDNRKNSPNITYIPSSMKMLALESCAPSETMQTNNGAMHLSDSLSMHDKIALYISQELDFENFEQIYNSLDCTKTLCIGDAIYRAVLSKNIRGRFFQLFTIIEALEAQFGKDAEIAHKLLPENSLNQLNKIINEYLKSIQLEPNLRGNLSSRINNLIANATLESRAKKLQLIIRNKLGIQQIEKGTIHYEITEQKVKMFIDARNSLFHGGNSNGDENKLVQLTNELQELCLETLKHLEL